MRQENLFSRVSRLNEIKEEYEMNSEKINEIITRILNMDDFTDLEMGIDHFTSVSKMISELEDEVEFYLK